MNPPPHFKQGRALTIAAMGVVGPPVACLLAGALLWAASRYPGAGFVSSEGITPQFVCIRGGQNQVYYLGVSSKSRFETSDPFDRVLAWHDAHRRLGEIKTSRLRISYAFGRLSSPQQHQSRIQYTVETSVYIIGMTRLRCP